VFKELSDKHEALTGRPLNPTLIVTDFEVRNKYDPYLIKTIPKIFPLWTILFSKRTSETKFSYYLTCNKSPEPERKIHMYYEAVFRIHDISVWIRIRPDPCLILMDPDSDPDT
jgi:hypothetical protein